MSPTLLHVAPHPDDEAVGCPGALLHLLDRGWTVINVITSLGFEGQWERRRTEAEEAARRAGFVPLFLDPPLHLDIDADLALATRRVATELPGLVEAHGASIVVSPSPHDVHHGHETVGRGVQRAMAALPPTVRWWMWGVWGDLPAPNVFYGFDASVLNRALHILEAYEGELARNDYRSFLSGRAAANAVMGSERVFGFGSPAATSAPLCRARDRGPARRRPVHGVGAALARPGPRALRALRRRPDAVARLADRPRARGVHPGGPGETGSVTRRLVMPWR